MADCIRLLPEIVANQIKAGEVVESPSSVVKEMMENAIDAGATEVTVNFVNGGRDLVQIIDNGRGMSPTDARMAFECHATSKIKSLDDIYALHTFGFRGEALSSIAAVSQVELLTRQEDDEVGTRTLINGGEFVSQTPIATPVGSQFLVKNLFYNTPARRKFINSKETSLTADIKREFRRVALCHPEVSCALMSNGAPLYNLPASTLVERVVGVMGNATRRNLLEVDVETSIASIKGFVGRPETARNNSSEQYMFVNGRFFRSPYLNKAVTKAYEKLIPERAFPSFFLYLTVDAERVDVNVHAQKTEVKFADNEAIWQIVNAAVRETLAKTGVVPLIDFDNEAMVEIPIAQPPTAIYSEPRSTTRDHYNPFEESAEEISPKGVVSKHNTTVEFEEYTPFEFEPSSLGESEFEYIESSDSAEQSLGLEGEVREEPRNIAIMGGRYAVATFASKAWVVDLVRARELMLYEGYCKLLDGGSAVTQQLLFPEELMLTEAEYDLVEDSAVDFASLGFDLKLKGGSTIEVFGIPADVAAEGLDRAIYDLVQCLKLPETAVVSRRNAMAQALAHSDSVRRATFTDEEASYLVNFIVEADKYRTPAGREIVVVVTTDDIKNRLG